MLYQCNIIAVLNQLGFGCIMEIFLYQIQYDDKTEPTKESGLLPFDCRDNPEFLKREVAHLLRFYDEVVQYASDYSYFALLSPKFSQKTGLLSDQVKQFIRSHPEQDIYLFNPYPMLVYRYLNVWQQLENNHPHTIDLVDKLLRKARVNFDIKKSHRNHINHVVYCNYWVASKTFYDAFIPFIRQLDRTIEQMESDEKISYFQETNYETFACVYPFIFERMIVLYLMMNANFRSLPYPFESSFCDYHAFNRIEKKFYFSETRKVFDRLELLEQHYFAEEKRAKI